MQDGQLSYLALMLMKIVWTLWKELFIGHPFALVMFVFALWDFEAFICSAVRREKTKKEKSSFGVWIIIIYTKQFCIESLRQVLLAVGCGIYIHLGNFVLVICVCVCVCVCVCFNLFFGWQSTCCFMPVKSTRWKIATPSILLRYNNVQMSMPQCLWKCIGILIVLFMEVIHWYFGSRVICISVELVNFLPP